MALLVMFNNFLHDFTAALWLCSAGLIWWLMTCVQENGQSQVVRFYGEIFDALFRTSLLCLAFNLFFGFNRALAYYKYEYLPAAGPEQVTALFLKHALIVVVVSFGIFAEIKTYKMVQLMKAGDRYI